jgi:hypothetical protein
MIHPSYPVTPYGGTGPVVAATPHKPALQQTDGNRKMTVPRHRSRQINPPVLIGVASFEAQGIDSPSLEPLSP